MSKFSAIARVAYAEASATKRKGRQQTGIETSLALTREVYKVVPIILEGIKQYEHERNYWKKNRDDVRL
jgi:hypothetical protein